MRVTLHPAAKSASTTRRPCGVNAAIVSSPRRRITRAAVPGPVLVGSSRRSTTTTSSMTSTGMTRSLRRTDLITRPAPSTLASTNRPKSTAPALSATAPSSASTAPPVEPFAHGPATASTSANHARPAINATAATTRNHRPARTDTRLLRPTRRECPAPVHSVTRAHGEQPPARANHQGSPRDTAGISFVHAPPARSTASPRDERSRDAPLHFVA